MRLRRKRILAQLEEDRLFIYQYLTLEFPYRPDPVTFIWAKVHFEHVDAAIVDVGGESYRDCFSDTEFLSRIEQLVSKKTAQEQEKRK